MELVNESSSLTFEEILSKVNQDLDEIRRNIEIWDDGESLEKLENNFL